MRETGDAELGFDFDTPRSQAAQARQSKQVGAAILRETTSRHALSISARRSTRVIASKNRGGDP
jgi:hypothetical protein